MGGLAVVSAVALVSFALPMRPLVLDEHVSYWLCAPEGELSISVRSLRYAATPPVTSWIQAASLAAFGKTELAMRLPSLVGYVASVAAMFVGCRSALGGRAAGLAALALAWHPDVVDEVRVGRPYGLVLLEMTALLAMTLQLASVGDNRRRACLLGAGWGLTAALAAWTHVLTIPVVAFAAVALWMSDWKRQRRPRLGTILATVIAVLLALPLLPMLLRMWEWRFALDYHTGAGTLGEALGPFVWLALPAGGFIALFRRSNREQVAQNNRRALWIVVMMGLAPLIILAIAGSELSSLNGPRYRAPMAAAQACLLGLLLDRARLRVGVAGLIVALAASWAVSGRTPLTLARLETPQADVWRKIGETLERTVHERGLARAPLFVQSGLIEGTLVPLMYDDPIFQGYLSSRLGRFYAETPNPRYGLPFFWESASPMTDYYRRLIAQAPGERSDLLVAVATDTDLNRASAAGFTRLLEEAGYQLTPLADYQPWAMLYHAVVE